MAATKRRFGYIWKVRRTPDAVLLHIKLDNGEELWRRVWWRTLPTGMLLGRRCELVPWGHGVTLWGR